MTLSMINVEPISFGYTCYLATGYMGIIHVQSCVLLLCKLSKSSKQGQTKRTIKIILISSTTKQNIHQVNIKK